MASPSDGTPPLTDAQVDVLVRVASNFQAAIRSLPPEKRREIEEAQADISRCRRAGERAVRNLWIG